jgi:hypothetical protein
MIAILSKTTSDSDMPVVLELTNPALYSGERRVSIAKTLDQGVTFSDQGFTTSDRQYQVKSIVSETVAAILKDLLEENTELTLAIWEGVFLVSPLSLTIKGNGLATFNFGIKEKLSA